MAISAVYQKESILPISDWVYTVTGLVNGANTINLPTPPAAGSFPPLADWTPTVILAFPYQIASIGALVTPDLTTITNTTGSISFTLYASGATNALIVVL